MLGGQLGRRVLDADVVDVGTASLEQPARFAFALGKSCFHKRFLNMQAVTGETFLGQLAAGHLGKDLNKLGFTEIFNRLTENGLGRAQRFF